MKRLMVLGVVVLAGCSTKSTSEMSYTELKSYAAEMHSRCKKQGVPDGQEMQLCMNQEANADQARRQRQKQVGAALAGASQSYGQSLQRSATIAQMNRPISCRSMRNVDGSVTTSCQ